MKTYLTIALLCFVAVATAQTKTELPRTEFMVDLSESSLIIKPGKSKTITLSIVRSKAYAKAKATLGFGSSLPNGITISYEPIEGNVDKSTVTIAIAKDAAPGVYQLVLSATLNAKKKGTILKLSVNNDQVAVN